MTLFTNNYVKFSYLQSCTTNFFRNSFRRKIFSFISAQCSWFTWLTWLYVSEGSRNWSLDLFQPIVAFYLEVSHLICCVNQVSGFYMKCNTGLKWVSGFYMKCNTGLQWVSGFYMKYNTGLKWLKVNMENFPG